MSYNVSLYYKALVNLVYYILLVINSEYSVIHVIYILRFIR